MATNTTHYNLVKPDKTDYFDIGVQNDNWDEVDKQLYNQKNIIEVTLSAAGWSNSYPYTQTVAVTGFANDDEPLLVPVVPDSITIEDLDIYLNIVNQIFDGEVTTTNATFYCSIKPDTEITVGLKGR